MATKPLGLPPPFLATENFPVTEVAPKTLYRVSSHEDGEPYFGNSGGNRFDAPGCKTGTAEFETCYLGKSLAVAVAESLLHDEDPVDGKFAIAPETIANMHVHRFAGDPLSLLSLTGPVLKRSGGSADLAGTGNYDLTQQWALAVHNNPANYDGFMYGSRHHNTGLAVVLFDRCRGKITPASHTSLAATPGFAKVADEFGIVGK